MHDVVYYTLLSVFLVYQMTFWYLLSSLLANLFVFPYYATPCNGGAEALKQPARRPRDKFRTQSALASAFAVMHNTIFWYTFTAGEFEPDEATGHLKFPEWMDFLVILSLGCSHVLLLILLHNRLVSIFAETEWRLSPRRQRAYLIAICLHFLLELSSLFLKENHRYIVWITYDVSLCLLCSAFTFEFIHRLFEVIKQIQWHIERAIVAQRQAIHEAVHNRPNLNNGLSNNRKTINSENDLNMKQIRLYELISKMTVLTGIVCISAIVWTAGPMTRMIMEIDHDSRNDRWLTIAELILHWNMALSVQLFIYFSFAFSEFRYRLIFGTCCDKAVLRCLVREEQSDFLETFLKMSARQRRTLMTISRSPGDSYVQMIDQEE